MDTTDTLLRKIRIWIALFIFGLVLSGVTAFPLQSELNWLSSHSNFLPGILQDWIRRVADGVNQTNNQFSFIAYGTDWLAFAHLVIAMAFIGPFRDPVRNEWVIDWAILCCVAIVPLALITGPIRSIPLFHQLIDISFGLVGVIPLLIVRKKIRQLDKLSDHSKKVPSTT
ncbi:MAG: hypothetical protein IPP51_06545 [Bacteroidetes bacterium]|nr:hypothetical protein [Bacteroidota bacterium]